MTTEPEYPAITEADMRGPADPADVLPGDVDLEHDPDETPDDDDQVEDEA